MLVSVAVAVTAVAASLSLVSEGCNVCGFVYVRVCVCIRVHTCARAHTCVFVCTLQKPLRHLLPISNVCLEVAVCVGARACVRGCGWVDVCVC